MKKTRVGNWITLSFIIIGFCVSGYIMYTGVQEAQTPDVGSCYSTVYLSNITPAMSHHG
jgi:hypothetical protein